MYLRHTTIRKDGKVHRYWRLVRSVRVGRRVIQQTIAQLGELDEHGRVEARALARRLIGTAEQPALSDGSEHVAVPVRLKGVRIERSRRFGDVYLALALWRGVGLEELCERLLRSARSASPGRRWRPCWWWRGYVNRRASCTLPRIGIVARRFAICCSLAMRRSTRIDFIARSIICLRTRRRWRCICRSAAANCLPCRTKCCCTT